MGRSLSQRLKRSSRYGTSNLTPKRPCLSTNLSPSATSSNCDLPCSSDRSLADLDKENESVAIENSPSMSHSSDQVPVIAVSDANSTPQNTTTDTSSNFRTPQSLEHLRQRRNELQRSIAAKEQTLRNLNLVKQHRTKVCCGMYLLTMLELFVIDICITCEKLYLVPCGLSFPPSKYAAVHIDIAF